MAKIYAVSDIHGCYKAFRQVLRLIDLSVSKENQLYLLGDYVDGGKDSYRILKQIMKLEQKYPEQIKVLWGNHDEAFMNWLEQKDNDLFGYLSSGGVSTIKSFFRDNPEEYNIIVKNADGKSKRAMVQDLIAAIKSVGNKTGLIKWLHKKDAASRFIETDNQIFVHAGIAEYSDGLWKYATADEEFTNMYPPKTGSFYKDIIAGHVWSTEVSKDLSYAGKVYWDGESHFFIDGNVLATKNIPVLEYDTETKKYFSFEKNTETDSLIKYEIK
ncbi:serine/threonine protein phosphatase [Enterococcus sp. MJM12]|uniref:Serine/threonine protein phosphatase n=1 Tax=Candidatus Enterococcus myersii TaxID=2815322 RepID=A0ABS3H8X4_9ENTE|nr:metallophosphoesterase [Enterococcus sp. MJM12]MBO0449073.1 serine/threonine protein phosphatase [Enterococcus sp. MJM12]